MRHRQTFGGSIAGLALAWILAGPQPAQAEMARYHVDPEHSTIEFLVAHMVVSKTTGRFTDYSGFIEMDPQAEAVKAIEATIRTASVTTHHPKRDAHLKGPDFFNVEAPIPR
jgi:polyisoprenoid-binding protein YceI